MTKHYLYFMKLVVIFLLCTIFSAYASAQATLPCTELDSVMAIEKEGPSEISVLKDKQILFDCGNFDEIDLILLFGDFLDELLERKLQNKDSLNYRGIIGELQKIQLSQNYSESYQKTKLRMTVLNSHADTNLVDANTELFTDFFPNEQERKDVRKFISNYQTDTLTLIEVLDKYLAETEKEETNETSQMSIQNKVNFFAFYDLTTALENGFYFGKPILLYYSAYANDEARRIEETWFNDAEINARMKQLTVFQIMCDDRMPMEPDDVAYFKKKYKKTFTYYGEKNAYLQQKDFKVTSQPYFVLYTVDGKKIACFSTFTTLDEFKLFLTKTKD